MKRRLNSGFTFVEVLVVIAIMGVLMSVIGFNVKGSQSQSKNAKLIAEVKQLQNGFELYYANKGNYAPLEDTDCSHITGDREYFKSEAPSTTEVSYDCDSDAYCVCVEVLDYGGVRKGANSAPGCSFADPKTHFCITNNQ